MKRHSAFVVFDVTAQATVNISSEKIYSALCKVVPNKRTISIQRQKYIFITIKVKINKNTFVGKIWNDIKRCLEDIGLKILY